jgi:hypothetical protein
MIMLFSSLIVFWHALGFHDGHQPNLAAKAAQAVKQAVQRRRMRSAYLCESAKGVDVQQIKRMTVLKGKGVLFIERLCGRAGLSAPVSGVIDGEGLVTTAV